MNTHIRFFTCKGFLNQLFIIKKHINFYIASFTFFQLIKKIICMASMIMTNIQ